MRILIIGGTRFIGARVAKRLLAGGHRVSLFHRGQTETELPASVEHIYGDRRDLPRFESQFRSMSPDVVLDMICHNQREALCLIKTFQGVAARAVVVSSMDVYRAYGCLLGVEANGVEEVPVDEDSHLRTSRFPYRTQAKSPDDMAFDYDKILVEEVVMNTTGLPGTVLRLAAVYGPGEHRFFDYLHRMADGRETILLDEQQARWLWTRGYVADVAAAIALACVKDRAAGRIYNVGEAHAETEAEWVRSIGRAAGWSGKVVGLPRQKLPEHLRMPYNFQYHLHADTNRIRKELGYAEHTSRDEAIKGTVEWELAHAPQQVDANRFNYEAEDAALEELIQNAGSS